MSVRVICDSACDVPVDVQERYHIRVVPLDVRVGSREMSTATTDSEQFWDVVAQEGEKPQTAAPPPARIEALVRPLVEAGHEVLALTLTGKLSAVHRSFVLAAEAFGQQMRVFDTQNLSLGAGVQVIAAARWATEGRPMAEILHRLQALRERVKLQAVLDTLDWAERGGRIAYLMPLIRRTTRVFRVKVLLHVLGGEVRLLGVQRSWRSGVKMLVQHTLDLAPLEALWVVHTRRGSEAHTLARHLAEAMGWPPDRVRVQEAGPVLAAHVGPGALATVAVIRSSKGQM